AAAVGDFDGAGEGGREGAAGWESGELVVVGEEVAVGCLLLPHDPDHAERDERPLHVPDLGGDVGKPEVLAYDPRMDDEEERPDCESGDDGESASAVAIQPLKEVEGCDGIDGGEAPVDGFAVVVGDDQSCNSGVSQ